MKMVLAPASKILTVIHDRTKETSTMRLINRALCSRLSSVQRKSPIAYPMAQVPLNPPAAIVVINKYEKKVTKDRIPPYSSSWSLYILFPSNPAPQNGCAWMACITNVRRDKINESDL